MFPKPPPAPPAEPPEFYRRGRFFVIRVALWYYVCEDAVGGREVWDEFSIGSLAVRDANDRFLRGEAGNAAS